MPNEAFPLAYADADLAAQAQAGLDAPLEPVGFDDAIDPANFPAEVEDGDATAAPGGVPDTSALLDWTFTRTDIAWPADDTVATGDLDVFAAGGYAGSGVSFSIHLGTKLAMMATGRRYETDAHFLTREPERYPFSPFLRLGQWFAYRWLHAKDAREAKRAI